MPLYCRWFVYRSILKYFLMRTSFSVVLWSGLTCTSFRGWPNIATISPLTIFYSFQNLIIPGKMAHTAFNNCVGQMIECCLPNLSACLLYIDSENKADDQLSNIFCKIQNLAESQFMYDNFWLVDFQIMLFHWPPIIFSCDLKIKKSL